MTTNSTPSGLWPALELSLPALEISRPESQHADEVSGTTESPWNFEPLWASNLS